jgi:SAM-dependent methyltransferase
MALDLQHVIPFGRSKAEYELMFNLTPDDLNKTIVGVGDGTASFNAEMAAQGNFVTSVDPLYEFSATAIAQQFNAVVDRIFTQIEQTPDDWVWSYHSSPQHLLQTRTQVLQTFAADYDLGKPQGRYITGSLPELPFPDRTFDLALSSYLLFVYTEQFSLDFHIAAIREMCRIAHKVRIFPLVMANRHERSPFIEPVRQALEAEGIGSTLFKTPYELQKGGNVGIVFSRLT